MNQEQVYISALATHLVHAARDILIQGFCAGAHGSAKNLGGEEDVFAAYRGRLADRLARLVLVQTPDCRNMKAWFARVTQRIMRTPGAGQYVNFISRRRFPPVWYRIAVADRTRHAAFTDPAREALEAGGCYCFASFVQGMGETREDDPLLRVPADLPVTVVWGARDRTHQRTDAASVQNHCPQAEIIRFDAVGHYPDLEAPEAFAALLRERAPTSTS